MADQYAECNFDENDDDDLEANDEDIGLLFWDDVATSTRGSSPASQFAGSFLGGGGASSQGNNNISIEVGGCNSSSNPTLGGDNYNASADNQFPLMGTSRESSSMLDGSASVFIAQLEAEIGQNEGGENVESSKNGNSIGNQGGSTDRDGCEMGVDIDVGIGNLVDSNACEGITKDEVSARCNTPPQPSMLAPTPQQQQQQHVTTQQQPMFQAQQQQAMAPVNQLLPGGFATNAYSAPTQTVATEPSPSTQHQYQGNSGGSSLCYQNFMGRENPPSVAANPTPTPNTNAPAPNNPANPANVNALSYLWMLQQQQAQQAQQQASQQAQQLQSTATANSAAALQHMQRQAQAAAVQFAGNGGASGIVGGNAGGIGKGVDQNALMQHLQLLQQAHQQAQISQQQAQQHVQMQQQITPQQVQSQQVQLQQAQAHQKMMGTMNQQFAMYPHLQQQQQQQINQLKAVASDNTLNTKKCVVKTKKPATDGVSVTSSPQKKKKKGVKHLSPAAAAPMVAPPALISLPSNSTLGNTTQSNVTNSQNSTHAVTAQHQPPHLPLTRDPATGILMPSVEQERKAQARRRGAGVVLEGLNGSMNASQDIPSPRVENNQSTITGVGEQVPHQGLTSAAAGKNSATLTSVAAATSASTPALEDPSLLPPNSASFSVKSNRRLNVVSSDTDVEICAQGKPKAIPSTRSFKSSSITSKDPASHHSFCSTDEDDKVQNNRDRNREHARNTRLRKKAYVERLKISVDELCRERDTLVSERATSATRMVEIHSKRVDVLRSFFALRASYNVDQKRELWASILDESCFTCTLPVTPYQSFPSSEVQLSNCQRTVVGVDAMMADVASNAVFLDSIVDRTRFPNEELKFQYTLVVEESVVAGSQVMGRWVMETLNAKKCGARTELSQRGMLCCRFNSSHKIVNLDFMFDVMAFMLQVKLATGAENFNDVVVPNTVQTCQKQFDFPMVMTLADRPYTIVQVNERWENLTGYKGGEVAGKSSCSILQGPDTVQSELEQLMKPVLFKRPSCAMVTNYTKSGRRYRNYMTMFPLSTDSRITHYFGLTTFVNWIDADNNPSVGRKRTAATALSSGSNMASNPSKRERESKNENYGPPSSSPGNKNPMTPELKVITASQHEKQSCRGKAEKVIRPNYINTGGTQPKQKNVEFANPITKKHHVLSTTVPGTVRKKPGGD